MKELINKMFNVIYYIIFFLGAISIIVALIGITGKLLELITGLTIFPLNN